jgi:hypothetical protein
MSRKQLILFSIILMMLSCNQNKDYQVDITDNASYWDTQSEYLKTKKMDIPESNLKSIELKPDKKAMACIQKEVNKQLDSLKKWHADFPKHPKLTARSSNYTTPEGLRIILSKYKADYEYTEIAVITVIANNTVVTYSESNKLGEDIKLHYAKQDGDSFIIYGTLMGNPETSYSGDFKLTFSENKRTLEYAYYENGY